MFLVVIAYYIIIKKIKYNIYTVNCESKRHNHDNNHANNNNNNNNNKRMKCCILYL